MAPIYKSSCLQNPGAKMSKQMRRWGKRCWFPEVSLPSSNPLWMLIPLLFYSLERRKTGQEEQNFLVLCTWDPLRVSLLGECIKDQWKYLSILSYLSNFIRQQCLTLSISTVNYVLCLAVTLSLNSCKNFATLGWKTSSKVYCIINVTAQTLPSF